MDIAEKIDEIKAYRKSMKGKCVSTTHRFTMKDFIVIAKELQNRFKSYNAIISISGVAVTIPMGGGRRI